MGKPQSYYDEIKQKFAEERDLRLNYRPEGTAQFTSDFSGELSKLDHDPYAGDLIERDPINDTVEVLFIGGGFSALLTSAKLREKGLDDIRIVDRGSDVGGTWYWNRYPGVACDVVSYDYMPLLDELDYVPRDHYAKGSEIYEHCQNIAKKYDLYKHAVFQTTVVSTVWHEDEQLWVMKTNRGDTMKARFVVCANGTLSKPKLPKIQGMDKFNGHFFHTSRWDYDFTGDNLEKLHDKNVGIIGTGATAVQAVPGLGEHSNQLYVFQRTPSSIDIRKDWPTDPNWARKLEDGWQAKRRAKVLETYERSPEEAAKLAAMTPEEKLRFQENQNIDYVMKIHKRIDTVVKDPETAAALKPWYMYMCKRPCFHNDYLPTFNRPNVELVDTRGKGIAEMTERGPIFEEREFPIDLLVFATGFEVQKTGIYNQILGRGGLDLEDKYRDGMRTLLGVHVESYPNMFVMGGYQASFQLNITNILMSQGEHIAEVIDFTRKHDYKIAEVTPEAEEWWVQEVIANRGKTGRNEECTPGYYNFEGQKQRRQDGNYNGGFRKYYSHMEDVRAKMKENFTFS